MNPTDTSETSPTLGTTVALTDAARVDVGLVGGKAQQLGRLAAAGRAVPPGFVVPSTVTDLGAIRAELAEALLEIGAPVAVRSSAVAEDRDHASYAGQYTTVLDVHDLEAVIAAIETCWASATSAAAASYRSAQGDSDARMAVIVQRMVPARCAGVAFSANPVTGADEIVVEAVAGLGDELTDGAVTPERWVTDANGRPELLDAPGAPVLTSADAATIASEVAAIAADHGGPVDIEWAFDGGVLWVVQSRPITALPIAPMVEPPKGQTWVRADAYFPEPITPLSYDAWLPQHTAAFAHVTEHFGLPFDGIDHRYWYGRVYDRLLPVGGVQKDHPLPPRVVLKLAMRFAPPLRKRLAIAARADADDLPMAAIEAWESGGRDRLRRRTRELLDVDRSTLNDRELADHLDDAIAQVRQAAIDHFTLSFAGTFILTGQLGLLMEELLGWAPERVVDLVQGHGGASTALGESLDALAVAVRSSPDERQALVAAWADRHGHRVLGGDLRQATWAEDPSVVDAMVDVRLDRPSNDSAGPTESAAAAEAEALAAITDPADRARFVHALERARRGRPYGDETEADALEAPALVRYIALEAGPRLVRAGVLRRPAEVFFLTTAELASVLRSGSIPVSELDRRQGEYRWALANDGPAVIGTLHDGVPTADVLPKAARPVAGAGLWSVALFEADATTVADAGADVGGLVGVPASPGTVTGPARVIADPSEFARVQPGDVLVCHHTMAAWSPVFPIVAGLVTEHGGPLSHPGTLAREYGIPAVLSVAGATTIIADGATVTVDGTRGLVMIAD